MIHYVCVATDSKLYFAYLLMAIPELVILGMDQPWEGYITKFKLFSSYLDTIPNDDIVCFIDSWDVMPTKNIVHLEEQFIEFSNNNPNVKMVVGYDNKDYFPFHKQIKKIKNRGGNTKQERLNAGQFIGYVKNVKPIVQHILNKNSNLSAEENKKYSDSTELTKYSTLFPEELFSDNTNLFFKVVTTPLIQVKIKETNYTYSFVHANGNGRLEDLIEKELNITIGKNERVKIYFTHVNSLLKKIKYLIKKET